MWTAVGQTVINAKCHGDDIEAKHTNMTAADNELIYIARDSSHTDNPHTVHDQVFLMNEDMALSLQKARAHMCSHPVHACQCELRFKTFYGALWDWQCLRVTDARRLA